MNTTEKHRYPIPDFRDLDPNFGYNYKDIIDAVLNETHIDVTGIPEYLYLYRGNQSYIIDIIKNEYFHLSRADQFEDPADCGVPKKKFFSFVKRKRINITNTKIENKYQEFINEIRINTIVCSLTFANDNESMWDEYANQKTGICIEYNIKEYFSKNNKHLVLYPVIYTDEIEKILPLAVKKEEIPFSNKNGKYITSYSSNRELEFEFSPGIINLLSICKIPKYKFEKEWRFFDRTQEGEKGRKESCPISKIYLGPNFYINPQKDEILNTIKEKNINFVQTRFENDRIIVEE